MNEEVEYDLEIASYYWGHRYGLWEKGVENCSELWLEGDITAEDKHKRAHIEIQQDPDSKEAPVTDKDRIYRIGYIEGTFEGESRLNFTMRLPKSTIDALIRMLLSKRKMSFRIFGSRLTQPEFDEASGGIYSVWFQTYHYESEQKTS